MTIFSVIWKSPGGHVRRPTIAVIIATRHRPISCSCSAPTPARNYQAFGAALVRDPASPGSLQANGQPFWFPRLLQPQQSQTPPPPRPVFSPELLKTGRRLLCAYRSLPSLCMLALSSGETRPFLSRRNSRQQPNRRHRGSGQPLLCPLMCEEHGSHITSRGFRRHTLKKTRKNPQL